MSKNVTTTGAAKVGEIIDGTSLGSLRAVELLINDIPEAEDDAVEKILHQLLGAQSPDQLDDPWKSEGLRRLVDVPIRIDRVTRRPSDYEDGLGVYLLIEGHNLRTDQPVTVTTGSASVCAQLVIAHRNGWLPLTVYPRGPKRPKANGRFPMHLEITTAAAVD